MVTTSLTRGRSPAAQTPRPGGSSPRSGRRPPRRWIGALILLALLLVSGAIVSALVLDQRLTGAPAEQPSSGSAGVLGAAAGGVRADRDHRGPGVRPARARTSRRTPTRSRFAYDKDPKTRWRTVQYLRNPKLGGIKRGVGLIFDLGTPQPVREVALTLSGNGTDVELRVPAQGPGRRRRRPR